VCSGPSFEEIVLARTKNVRLAQAAREWMTPKSRDVWSHAVMVKERRATVLVGQTGLNHLDYWIEYDG
jgi:hypothetical protein